MTRELLYFYAVVFLLVKVLVPADLQAGSSSNSGLRSTIREKSDAQRSSKPLSKHEEFMEGKTRLGSIPPNCHNKCNACLPCKVIQVPASATHLETNLKASLDPSTPKVSTEGASNKKYSNYKAMGWKCKCGHRLFNP